MAGMAIAIPGVLNISTTGTGDDTMQWSKSGDIRAKNRRKWPKNITNVQKYRCIHPCHPYQSGAMPPLDIKYLC